MDNFDALEFISNNHHAVLATTRADGRSQMSPVAAGVDSDGKVIISTRETAFKVANLARDSRGSLLIMTEGFFGPWVQVEGPVEILRLPDAMVGLVALYRQIAGEHPGWDEFKQAMNSEKRVLLRMTIVKAGPNRSG